jgi:[acyl-carrier-protein] S-malonyltransferase
MRAAVAGVTFRDPAAPLLANADARRLETGEACRAELIEHLTAGVDWVAAVERMIADGVVAFVETGPGKVLTGLLRRIAPDAQPIATDDLAADGGLAIPFLGAPASTPSSASTQE